MTHRDRYINGRAEYLHDFEGYSITEGAEIAKKESEERRSIDKALDKLDVYDLIEFITVASDRGKKYIIRSLVANVEKLQRIKKIIND